MFGVAGAASKLSRVPCSRASRVGADPPRPAPGLVANVELATGRGLSEWRSISFLTTRPTGVHPHPPFLERGRAG
jgi:hypothetical protein